MDIGAAVAAVDYAIAVSNRLSELSRKADQVELREAHVQLREAPVEAKQKNTELRQYARELEEKLALQASSRADAAAPAPGRPGQRSPPQCLALEDRQPDHTHWPSRSPAIVFAERSHPSDRR